jgi:hypothetical protein
MAADSTQPDGIIESGENEELGEEDCYFEGPYLIFTEAYHLRRGYCCQSGCRHCPYGFNKPALSVESPAK